MFFRTYHLFTILGFKVRIDLSWLILALLVVTTTAEGFIAPPFEVGTVGAVTLGLFFAGGLLMSIVLHELSHSLMARRHGMQIRGITLFILGGVAEMEDEPQRPWAEFVMAIVGPISSLAIGGACGLVAWGARSAGAPAAVVELISQLAFMNVVLAIFNLIPAFPLDGGRVLRAALWGLKGDALWATRIASRLGQGFGIVLMACGLVAAVTLKHFAPLTWMLVGWFLWRAAPMPYRVLRVRSRLAASTIAQFVDTSPVVVPQDLPVSELIARVHAHGDDDALPVIDGSRIVGLVSVGAARRVPVEEQRNTPVGEITSRLPGDAVVGPATTAEDAVRRMQRLQVPTLLVVDASRLVGIVRWHDLRAFAEAS